MSKEDVEDEGAQRPEPKRLPVVKTNVNFDPKHLLGHEGPLAKGVADYQVRTPQIILADTIRQAFRDDKHLIAEASTGTGKSYACLIAAFEKTIETGLPVVISTHTISLQEQLYDKDIPFLVDRLKLKGLNVTLAKGRNNYVSIRRARLALSKREESKQAQVTMENFNRWLNTTKDGTLSSLPNLPDSNFWGRVRSDTDQCLGETCPTYNDCFYQTTRKKLGDSHIIITNHSLVLLDRKMKAGGQKGILPDYQYLILDEVHELEAVARQVFTFELKQKDLPVIFYELTNDKGLGFLDQYYSTHRENNLMRDMDDTFSKTVKEAHAAIAGLLQENEDYFKKVGSFLGDKHLLRFTQPNEIKTNFMAHFKTVLENLKTLNTQLSDKNEKLAIEFVSKKSTEIAMGLDKIIELPNVSGKDYSENVCWADSRTVNKVKSYSVVCSPIFLKSILNQLLFRPLKSVVMTSATLATGGNDPFRLIKSALGLMDPMQIKLPSVFDFQKQAKIVIVTDMPEQNKPTYEQDIADQTKKYVHVSHGGAFILFTSFKTMNAVYQLTKDSFEAAGYKLFVQGKDLGRTQMIEQFKTSMHSVLFGVSSFWTGVDVPGNALRNIVITKLPFPSPDDPLMKAQEEIYKKFKKNFFVEKSVPMTAIMLKQGFGRLIRRSSDKGIVIILDSRIVTKKYGGMLLSALPSCPTLKVTKDTPLARSSG